MNAAQAVTAVGAYQLTTGRFFGSLAALIALAGVVVGWLALARPNRTRNRPVVAVAAGLIGLLGGALVLAFAKGGPGTGYGVVGGYAALAVGLIATVLGGLAGARSR
jgi:Family of unknown function (DUF6223)